MPISSSEESAKKPPTLEELEEMMDEGYCLATDGCTVEPDGYCEHGKPSWLIVLGLI